MQQQKEWYMMILKIDLEWHIHTVSFRWKYGNLCTRACLSHDLLKGNLIRLINLFRWECWRLPQGILRHSGAERWWGWLFCCFAVTVCTCRWHSDNFRCGQWWLSSIKPGSASMNISDDHNHLGTFFISFLIYLSRVESINWDRSAHMFHQFHKPFIAPRERAVLTTCLNMSYDRSAVLFTAAVWLAVIMASLHCHGLPCQRGNINFLLK